MSRNNILQSISGIAGDLIVIPYWHCCSCAQKGVCVYVPSRLLESHLAGRQTHFKKFSPVILILVFASKVIFLSTLEFKRLSYAHTYAKMP